MSNNFTLSQYTITTTLKEDLLFIRVLNSISFESYENNISLNDINLPFEKKQRYDILVNCLSKKENYNVIFNVKQNSLEMIFNAVLEGIFTINFNIVLPEKKQTDENSLIFKINQMEIEHKNNIEQLYIKNCNYQQQLGEYNQLIDRMNRDMKFMDISFQKRLSDFNELIEKMNIEHKKTIEKMESKIDIMKNEFETMKIDYEEKLNKSYELIEINNCKINKLERIIEGLSDITFPNIDRNTPYLDIEILHISDGKYNGHHYGHCIYFNIPICRINCFINLHTLGLINFKSRFISTNIYIKNSLKKNDFINYTVKKLSLIYCNNVVFKGIKCFSILEEIEIIDNLEIDNELKISIESSLDTLVNLKKIVLKNITSNIIELFKKYCKNRGIECEIY